MLTQSGNDHVLRSGLERRLRFEWWSTVTVLLILTFLLSYFSQFVGLKRLDDVLYGRVMALATHAPSDDVVIVTLDEDSLHEMGYWPWRRSVHAELLESLGSAKAVGFDLLFSDPNPAYPDDDESLAQSMREHGRVVLPLVVDQGQVRPPLPILADAAAAMGYINAYLDTDSVVRAVSLNEQIQGQRVQHFGLAMLAAGGEAVQTQADTTTRRRLISYAGDSGSYQMFPYARVLDGSLPASAFDNKYVLVGAWAAALGDTLSVPLSNSGEPMAGVEILANVLQNIIDDRWIQTPTRLQAALLCLSPVLLTCLALRRLSPRRSFFVVLLTIPGIVVFDWLLMRYAGLWIDPSAAFIGIVLAYPLWNWRSQEATLRQVDAEVDQLYEQNLMHGQASSEAGHVESARSDGSLPARMVKLHQAIGVLGQAIVQRETALNFLSHDMRSPQNAILALTQLQRSRSTPLPQAELLDRVDSCANRTLALVDGFVRLARAESMAMDFREIDLTELLQSVCDERWPMAQEKDIVLSVQDDSVPAYVLADESMLSRALGNLIDNAIHYSASGTRVVCRLYEQGQSHVVAIRDQGRGMTTEQQAGLFEPFRRFDADAPGNPDGSGLGLAFVQAVVRRHGGRIELTSEPGRGSEFRISVLGCFSESARP